MSYIRTKKTTDQQRQGLIGGPDFNSEQLKVYERSAHSSFRPWSEP